MTRTRVDKKVWLDCVCARPEHSVRISLHYGRALALWVEPQLKARRVGFFQRIWIALKFVFLREPDMFEGAKLSEDSVDKLSRVVVSYRLLKKLRNAKKNRARRE